MADATLKIDADTRSAERALGQLQRTLQGLSGIDRKSTRLNSSHSQQSRMPSSA